MRLNASATSVAFPLGIVGAPQIALETLTSMASQTAGCVSNWKPQELTALLDGHGIPRAQQKEAKRQLVTAYFIGAGSNAVDPPERCRSYRFDETLMTSVFPHLRSSLKADALLQLPDDSIILVTKPAILDLAYGFQVFMGMAHQLRELPVLRKQMFRDGGSRRITTSKGDVFIPRKRPRYADDPPASWTPSGKPAITLTELIPSPEVLAPLGVNWGVFDSTRETRLKAWRKPDAPVHIMNYLEVDRRIDEIPRDRSPGIDFQLSPILGFRVQRGDELLRFTRIVGFAAFEGSVYVAKWNAAPSLKGKQVTIIRIQESGPAEVVDAKALSSELRAELNLNDEVAAL